MINVEAHAARCRVANTITTIIINKSNNHQHVPCDHDPSDDHARTAYFQYVSAGRLVGLPCYCSIKAYHQYLVHTSSTQKGNHQHLQAYIPPTGGKIHRHTVLWENWRRAVSTKCVVRQKTVYQTEKGISPVYCALEELVVFIIPSTGEKLTAIPVYGFSKKTPFIGKPRGVGVMTCGTRAGSYRSQPTNMCA